jgi:hypothetical protein
MDVLLTRSISISLRSHSGAPMMSTMTARLKPFSPLCVRNSYQNPLQMHVITAQSSKNCSKPQQEVQGADQPKNASTVRIVLQKAPTTPGAKPHSNVNGAPIQKSGRVLRKGERKAPQESTDLIKALSNPFVYHRPILLPALQSLIQSLEVAYSCVEAYASGEYMTDRPINFALARVRAAWTRFISPLNALNRPLDVSKTSQHHKWSAEEERERKAVGTKLLALAVEKQRCVFACAPPNTATSL